MKAYLERLMAHAHWANARTLDALRSGAAPEDAVRLFAHVLTTEQIYLARMQGQDPWPQDFWPARSLDDCARLVPENLDRYRSFFAPHTDATLRRRVRYRNSKGEVFHTPIAEMLTHLALHGEHHRGQIAHLVRRAGTPPAVTDFITFVREQDAS